MDFLPSLKHMAVVRIAGLLCNHSTVKDIIFSHIEKSVIINCKMAEGMVISLLEDIEIPTKLKAEISNIIKPMSKQIYTWNYNIYKTIRYHHFDNYQVIEFCWTSQGTLNEKKMLDELLSCKRLHVYDRFVLACTNCFEDHIHTLFEKVPGFYKNRFHLISEFSSLNLLKFWSYFIRCKMNLMPNLEDVWSHGFNLAIKSNSYLGVKYFWNKCPSLIMQKVLNFEISLSTECPSILSFLFLKMDHHQLRNFLQNCFQTGKSAKLLSQLIDFPYQNIFRLVVENTWDFLPGVIFVELIKKIIQNLATQKDYNYRSLLDKMWSKSHDHHKRYFFGSMYSHKLFASLRDGSELLLLFLSDINCNEMRNMMLSHNGPLLCISLLNKRKWELLNTMISKCNFNSVQNNDYFKFLFSEKYFSHLLTFHSSVQECEELEKNLSTYISIEILEKYKKNFINHFSKSCWLDSLLLVGKFDVVDIILDWCLKSEREKFEFKMKFAHEKKKDICMSYIFLKKWELVDEFISRYIPNKIEGTSFKTELNKEYQMFGGTSHAVKL